MKTPRRRGSARSSAAVIKTFRVFRIILTNAVKYVTNVDAYRIQSATDVQAKKMQRKAEFLLKRALRQAGWKPGSSLRCILAGYPLA